MNNNILLLLLGSISLGFVEAFNGRIFKKYPKLSSVGFILVGSLGHLILTISFIIIFKIPLVNIGILTIILIIVMGLVSYYANRLFYNSFKYQEASVSTLIAMSTIVVTTILGRVMFAERVNLYQWMGVFLILFAVFTVNAGGLRKENLKSVFKPTKATKYVLLSALLWGIYTSLLKFISQDLHPYWYLLFETIFTVPFYFLLDRKEIFKQFKVLKNKKLFIILSFTIIFYFLYNSVRITSLGNGLALPLVDAVDNFVVFNIIFFEVVLFKVKQKDILLKIFCSIIAVGGVLLISFCG
jgi:drug/metabolite transporter (DMT)-like permease